MANLVTVEPHVDAGDAFIPLPDEILLSFDLAEGDAVEVEASADGFGLIIRKAA